MKKVHYTKKELWAILEKMHTIAIWMQDSWRAQKEYTDINDSFCREWEEYDINISELMEDVKYKAKKYKTSIEFKEMQRCVEQIINSRNAYIIGWRIERALKYKGYQEDLRSWRLKDVNIRRDELRRIERKFNQNHKLNIAKEYIDGEILEEEAMERLKVKDKRTLMKYVKLELNRRGVDDHGTPNKERNNENRTYEQE